MKILAIFGGRRKSSSEAMAKLVLQGAKELGGDDVTVTAVRLLDLNIGPCTGCNACVDGLLSAKGIGECVNKDDFQWLSEHILDADGIVVSLPIFEKTVPGYFKDLCDRCGPGMDAALRTVSKRIREANGISEMPDSRTWKRRVVSFIAHGGSDWNQTMMPVMTHFAVPLNMEIIDQMLIPWDRQVLLHAETVKRLKKSGSHMYSCLKNMPEVMPYIGMDGLCPVCHGNVFNIDSKTATASCGMCGINGKLCINTEGHVHIKFSEEELTVSHALMGGKFKHLDDMKNIGSSAKDLMPKILETKKNYSELLENSRPDK